MLIVEPSEKERWIFIFSDDPDEPADFTALIKAYRDKLSGNIVELSDDMQYRVDNDELNLIFQWDDCFGITVIVPEATALDAAYSTLKDLCEAL